MDDFSDDSFSRSPVAQAAPSRVLDLLWDFIVLALAAADVVLHVCVIVRVYASSLMSSPAFLVLSSLALVCSALCSAILIQRAFVDDYATNARFRAVVFAVSLPLAPFVPFLLWLHSRRAPWFIAVLHLFQLDPHKPPPFAAHVSYDHDHQSGVVTTPSILVRLGLGAEGERDDAELSSSFDGDDSGVASADRDAIRDYLRRKAWAHAGCTAQALTQGIANVLLIIIALAYSPSVSVVASSPLTNSDGGLLIASLLVSVMSVSSKGVYLSYSLDRATMIFNSFCFVADATGVAAVSVLVLVSQSASSLKDSSSWSALRWTLMPLSSAWDAGTSTLNNHLAFSWFVKEMVLACACALAIWWWAASRVVGNFLNRRQPNPAAALSAPSVNAGTDRNHSFHSNSPSQSLYPSALSVVSSASMTSSSSAGRARSSAAADAASALLGGALHDLRPEPDRRSSKRLGSRSHRRKRGSDFPVPPPPPPLLPSDITADDPFGAVSDWAASILQRMLTRALQFSLLIAGAAAVLVIIPPLLILLECVKFSALPLLAFRQQSILHGSNAPFFRKLFEWLQSDYQKAEKSEKKSLFSYCWRLCCPRHSSNPENAIEIIPPSSPRPTDRPRADQSSTLFPAPKQMSLKIDPVDSFAINVPTPTPSVEPSRLVDSKFHSDAPTEFATDLPSKVRALSRFCAVSFIERLIQHYAPHLTAHAYWLTHSHSSPPGRVLASLDRRVALDFESETALQPPSRLDSDGHHRRGSHSHHGHQRHGNRAPRRLLRHYGTASRSASRTATRSQSGSGTATPTSLTSTQTPYRPLNGRLPARLTPAQRQVVPAAARSVAQRSPQAPIHSTQPAPAIVVSASPRPSIDTNLSDSSQASVLRASPPLAPSIPVSPSGAAKKSTVLPPAMPSHHTPGRQSFTHGSLAAPTITVTHPGGPVSVVQSITSPPTGPGRRRHSFAAFSLRPLVSSPLLQLPSPSIGETSERPDSDTIGESVGESALSPLPTLLHLQLQQQWTPSPRGRRASVQVGDSRHRGSFSSLAAAAAAVAAVSTGGSPAGPLNTAAAAAVAAADAAALAKSVANDITSPAAAATEAAWAAINTSRDAHRVGGSVASRTGSRRPSFATHDLLTAAAAMKEIPHHGSSPRDFHSSPNASSSRPTSPRPSIQSPLTSSLTPTPPSQSPLQAPLSPLPPLPPLPSLSDAMLSKSKRSASSPLLDAAGSAKPRSTTDELQPRRGSLSVASHTAAASMLTSPTPTPTLDTSVENETVAPLATPVLRPALVRGGSMRRSSLKPDGAAFEAQVAFAIPPEQHSPMPRPALSRGSSLRRSSLKPDQVGDLPSARRPSVSFLTLPGNGPSNPTEGSGLPLTSPTSLGLSPGAPSGRRGSVSGSLAEGRRPSLANITEEPSGSRGSRVSAQQRAANAAATAAAAAAAAAAIQNSDSESEDSDSEYSDDSDDSDELTDSSTDDETRSQSSTVSGNTSSSPFIAAAAAVSSSATSSRRPSLHANSSRRPSLGQHLAAMSSPPYFNVQRMPSLGGMSARSTRSEISTMSAASFNTTISQTDAKRLNALVQRDSTIGQALHQALMGYSAWSPWLVHAARAFLLPLSSGGAVFAYTPLCGLLLERCVAASFEKSRVRQALLLLEWDLDAYRRVIFGVTSNQSDSKSDSALGLRRSATGLMETESALTSLWRQYAGAGAALIRRHAHENRVEADLAVFEHGTRAAQSMQNSQSSSRQSPLGRGLTAPAEQHKSREIAAQALVKLTTITRASTLQNGSSIEEGGWSSLSAAQKGSLALQLFLLYVCLPLSVAGALHSMMLPPLALIFAGSQASNWQLDALPTILCGLHCAALVVLLALSPKVLSFQRAAWPVRMFGVELQPDTADRLIAYHQALGSFEALRPLLQDEGNLPSDVVELILQFMPAPEMDCVADLQYRMLLPVYAQAYAQAEEEADEAELGPQRRGGISRSSSGSSAPAVPLSPSYRNERNVFGADSESFSDYHPMSRSMSEWSDSRHPY